MSGSLRNRYVNSWSTSCKVRNPLDFRMRGEDIGDGWIVHTLPHKNSKYYYHRDLKLVTTEDMMNRETRSTFLSNYRTEADTNRPFETVVYANRPHMVNHMTETLDNQDISGAYPENLSDSRLSDHAADESRSKYWIYLCNHPCHHNLPISAEKEALTILQLMMTGEDISRGHRDADLSLDQRILVTWKAWPAHHSRCQTSSDTLISSTFQKHLRLPVMMCPVRKVLLSATSLLIFVRHSFCVLRSWTSHYHR